MANGKLRGEPRIAEASLDRHIAADPRLAAADVPLADNGLTIEGLAVKGQAMTVGFRGPAVGGNAIVLTVPLVALFDGSQALGGAQTLPLGSDTFGKPRGVRDLSTVAGGFVGIAGPVLDPADENYVIRRGDYAVFWWDGHSAPVLRELDGYGVKVKPEAIVPLALDAGKLRALLLFDGPLDGQPTEVELTFPPPA
jgi:hypothetical protein